jgi:hypothetical protein
MKTIPYLFLLLLCGALPRTMSYAGSPAPAPERKPAESRDKAVRDRPAGEETKAAPKEEDFAAEENLLHHKQAGLHTLPKSEKASHAAAKPALPKPASVNIKHPEQGTAMKSRPGNTLANSLAAPAKSMTVPRKTALENKPENPPPHSEGVVPLGEPTLQMARARAGGTATLGGPMASSLKTTSAAISGTGYRGRTY